MDDNFIDISDEDLGIDIMSATPATVAPLSSIPPSIPPSISGSELLMNDKYNNQTETADLPELDLTDIDTPFDASAYNKSSDAPPIIPPPPQQPSIGEATQNIAANEASAWDGFGQMNDAYYAAETANNAILEEPKMSKDQVAAEKFKYLKLLEKMEKKNGITLSKQYTVESSLAEMKGEYEYHKAEHAREKAIKFQANALTTMVSGIEYFNNKFDPLDLKLDGWSDQIEDDIDSYDDVFGELHDLYGGTTQVHPLIALGTMVISSAVGVHISNTLTKSSAMPSDMDELLRTNPKLRADLEQAVMRRMAAESPEMANLARITQVGQQARSAAVSAPVQTYQQRAQSAVSAQSAAMEDDLSAFPRAQRPPGLAAPPHIPEYEQQQQQQQSQTTAPPPKRAAMRGPSDISDILSGIKTTTVPVPQPPVTADVYVDDGSDVSVASSVPADGARRPVKVRRKPRSAKNTVSIDL